MTVVVFVPQLAQTFSKSKHKYYFYIKSYHIRNEILIIFKIYIKMIRQRDLICNIQEFYLVSEEKIFRNSAMNFMVQIVLNIDSLTVIESGASIFNKLKLHPHTVHLLPFSKFLPKCLY